MCLGIKILTQLTVKITVMGAIILLKFTPLEAVWETHQRESF